MALSTNPDLVLLDEPTAGMTGEETAEAVELDKTRSHRQITDNHRTRHGCGLFSGGQDYGATKRLSVGFGQAASSPG